MIKPKPRLGIAVLIPPASDIKSITEIKLMAVAATTHNKLFITSPKIHEALTKAQIPPYFEFGSISLSYNQKTHHLDIFDYYPLPVTSNAGVDKRFAGLGIAEAFDTILGRQIPKLFPEAKKISVRWPSEDKERQERKRGFTPEQLREGIKITKWIAAARKKRHDSLVHHKAQRRPGR